MSEWLEINGYLLKDTILNAVAAGSTDLQLSQSISGHASQRNTRRYTRLSILSDTLRVVLKLVIPKVHSRFGSYDELEVIFIQYRSSNFLMLSM